MQIEFKDIPIFRFFDKDSRLRLGAIGHKLLAVKDDVLLQAGGPVQGIYLLVDGALHVCLPPERKIIATIERGGTVGEMSVVEEVSAASADIVVASDEAKILLFRTEEILTLANECPACAHALYRGAAVLISQRLRQTNKALQEHSGVGLKLIQEVMEQTSIFACLSQTCLDLNDTSSAIVTKLAAAVPMIGQIVNAHPELTLEMSELEQQIEDVFLMETQKFDRISQHLTLILQQFDNIRRVAAGQNPVAQKGDTHLRDDRAS